MSNLLDPTTLFSVDGLVAVVTGGGTGIGLMIATALENNGATVYIIGRRLEVLEKAAKENSKHGKMIPVKGDVTSRESILSVVEKVKAEQGHLNLLVNNSGVCLNIMQPPTPDADIKSFQSNLWNAGTPEDFNKSFEINVTAVYYTTVAFLELLHAANEKAGPGKPTSQVIIISSIGAFRRDAKQFSLSYGSSKAAVTQLGKLLSNFLLPWNIRCNSIAPGLYPSEMSAGFVSRQSKVEPSVVPLQRLGDEQDMAGLVLFLASRAGAYINGGVHITDGGRLGLFSSTF
ncbi:NAD-P-binding protein [Rickenella mellea]|uniref:NAD-P-binding protein n=1 Tax=Rickenella mellea TaxID=50990 RepID=A0A4Y7Q9I9_9AGAM|nr:NAD-P-binding protein [Rickenella mellea]